MWGSLSTTNCYDYHSGNLLEKQELVPTLQQYFMMKNFKHTAKLKDLKMNRHIYFTTEILPLIFYYTCFITYQSICMCVCIYIYISLYTHTRQCILLFDAFQSKLYISVYFPLNILQYMYQLEFSIYWGKIYMQWHLKCIFTEFWQMYKAW